MPRKRTHQIAGAIVGATTAALAARDEKPQNIAIEAFGGGTVGWFLGPLPDRIDRPLSPNHRSVAHAIIPVGSASACLALPVLLAQQELRKTANEQALKQTEADSFWIQLCHLFLEFVCRFLSGVLVGALGGYGSHLVLDAGTSKGLPRLA